MNIDRYKSTHVQILGQIDSLRSLIRLGVVERAGEIAELIVTISSGIKFHLAAEDSVLYPALIASGEAGTVAMARQYQAEMTGIADAFKAFVLTWRVESRIAADPDGFRQRANTVFRALYERLQREDHELYPAAERVQPLKGRQPIPAVI
jgi:hypothetical protein